MKTVGDILKISAEFLSSKGITGSRYQAEELLSNVLKIPRIELYMQFDRPLIEVELEQFRAFIKLRAQKTPWQYIVGEVRFLDCVIGVNRNVLIPRQETEILADLVLKELPPTPVVIWDICCGSGCLGIAIKKKRPDCRVVLSDISHQGVATATINAQKNGVELIIRQGDLCHPFQDEKADIVVCNPPYISEVDYATLDPEVRDFEPREALVGGSCGTEIYERLAKELSPYLNPGAKVYLEIGAGMGGELKTLFTSSGWVADVFNDWSSRERFMRLEIQPPLL